MSKKKTPILSAVRKYLATTLAVAVFLLPIYVSATWISGIARGTDSRETGNYQNLFQTRPADKNPAAVVPFNEPLLTVTFDDGWQTAYTVGLPIMQEYGVISTQYILAGEFENTVNVSEDQVKSFQKHGHEIASHTFDHPNLTTLNDSELHKQVVDSKQELEEKFGVIKDFAPPLGAMNEKTTNLIKKNYRSQRNTDADPITIGDEDVNTSENFNQYNIMAFTVRSTTTIEEIERMVDYAVKANAWAVITYHQIDDSESMFAVNEATFKAQMKMLFNKQIRIKTMGQILDAVEARKTNE